MNSYEKYLEAIKYINEGLIRESVPDSTQKLPRREWMLRFLDELGHPEQAFPAVHIAGTSGKGSTALLIAEGFRSAGYKVGLHTSPYLQVATEKLWYDGLYASADEFYDLVTWIKPKCERWRDPDVPLHGMASVGICLEYFRRKKVDIAVIETGVGGRDDLTNILNTKLSVITKLGIDHTKTLGGSIEEIAEHKAGIIKNRIPVVAYKGGGADVIERVANEKSAPLFWWEPDTNHGTFVQENIEFSKFVLRQILPKSTEMPLIKPLCLPGRMEVLQKYPKLIIDGAHNGQKLENLFKSLGNDYPVVCIIGFLKSKFETDLNIIRVLDNFRGRIIVTSPEVYGKPAASPRDVQKALKRNDVIIEPGPKSALLRAIHMSRNDEKMLVTGSLYLAGNIREIYYPSQKIIEQKTSWPQ